MEAWASRGFWEPKLHYRMLFPKNAPQLDVGIPESNCMYVDVILGQAHAVLFWHDCHPPGVKL